MVAEREAEQTEFEWLDPLWRYRKVVVAIFLLALAAAATFTALSPKRYASTATVLAPKEGSGNLLGGLAASALLQQAPALWLGATPSLTQNRDMLVSILKSRTLADALVRQFRLQERFRSRYFEDAVSG